MSSPELALLNLGAWSLQVAVLALAAAVVLRLLPVERPALRLALLQWLLLGMLLRPWLQPWRPLPAGVSWQARLSLQPAARPDPMGAPAASEAAPSRTAAAILGLLGAGAIAQLVRLAIRLARLRRIRLEAAPFEAPPWLEATRRQLAPRARLLVSDQVDGPSTCGLLRPLVLLPRSLPSRPPAEQQAVLLHELLHARRADWLALVVEEALAALVFFHPAVHWLVGRLRLAREQCVDAEVVRRLGDRHGYLDSLLAVARASARARAVPAATFLTESHLRERVNLLLKEVSMSRPRALAHATVAAAVLAVALAWTVAAVPLQAAGPPASVDLRDDPSAELPKLLHRVDPVYPPEAKKDGVSGVFVIEVVIGVDGAIANPAVVLSAPSAERLGQLKPQKGTPAATEGDPRLAEAALAAVRQWRYQPILKDGTPVEARATLTVAFKLR